MSSYSPSSLALSLEQFPKQFEDIKYKIPGDKSKFGGIFTEQKKLGDENGKFFLQEITNRNTVPMLHLKMQG
jgi:hypothetical protein